MAHMEGGGFSQIGDALQSLITHWAPSGAGVIVGGIVLAIVYMIWDACKKAIGDHLKPWMTNPRNTAVTLVVLLVGMLLVQDERFWTLVAFLASVAFILVARRRRWKAFSRRSAAAGAVLAVAVLLGAAYWYDDYSAELRNESFDVAFLLPPRGPTEPHKLFVNLRQTMNAVFSGVARVRVVPKKLSKEQVPEYSGVSAPTLLAYKEDGLRPKVYIESRFAGYSAAAPDASFRMLLTPWHRVKDKDRILPVSGWSMEPMYSTNAGMEGATIRGNFELIVFLSSKNILRLSPDARQTIWANILREYQSFLDVAAPACSARGKVKQRINSGGVLGDEQVRALLNEPCKEIAATKNRDAEFKREVEMLQLRNPYADLP